MNEYLCPFDFLQFGPLLAVHASIMLMNADWSGTDLRLITTRDPSWRHLKLKHDQKHSVEVNFLRTVFIFSCRPFYFLYNYVCWKYIGMNGISSISCVQCSMCYIHGRYGMTTLNNCQCPAQYHFICHCLFFENKDSLKKKCLVNVQW